MKLPCPNCGEETEYYDHYKVCQSRVAKAAQQYAQLQYIRLTLSDGTHSLGDIVVQQHYDILSLKQQVKELETAVKVLENK